MYCPKCGQQQLMEAASFCFKCGFALDPLKRLLKGNGGSTTPKAESPNLQEDLETVSFPVPSRIEDVEHGMILTTLRSTRGNKTRTAELLGISLKTLHNKLNEYRAKGLPDA
jgi:DNA-binding NtrC family response regulator